MQKRVLEQMSVYDKKMIHDIFVMSVEWLEKYIETAGFYDDWQNRKQIHSNNIKRQDIISNPEKVKESFSTVLFILQTNLQDVPSEFRREIKQEFYRWISAIRISIDNCNSDELKSILYQVNKVLEGDGDKIREDIENRKRSIDYDSPEYMERFKKMFASAQEPMRNEKEAEKIWKNKTDEDWKKESRFNDGDSQQGERAFKQIIERASNNNFYFFPQKDKQHVDTGNDDELSDYNLEQVRRNFIESIKQNIKDWNVKEVITSKGYFSRKKEVTSMLVHRKVKFEYDEIGGLIKDIGRMYYPSDFDEAELIEINQALKDYRIIRQQRIDNHKNLTRKELVDLIIEPEDKIFCQEAEIQRLKSEPSQIPEIQGQLQSMEIETNELKASLNSIIVSNEKINADNNFPIVPIAASLISVISLLGLIAYQVKKNKVKK